MRTYTKPLQKHFGEWIGFYVLEEKKCLGFNGVAALQLLVYWKANLKVLMLIRIGKEKPTMMDWQRAPLPRRCHKYFLEYYMLQTLVMCKQSCAEMGKVFA
uniref:Testis cDNA clone: QtsA-14185, similar to human hypothetical protein MGC27069 (FLJ25449) n=1 Tax=Macaca fascicularis TaxID=9541 RepID=Q4R7X2_MACFA|nr:unnamed protein product [Macaca fascicularis]